MSKRIRIKAIFTPMIVVLVLVLASTSVYLFVRNRDLNDQLNLTTEQKNSRLVEEINNVYKLPDETPVVAVVTSPDEFKTQYPSFTDAQNGDYLLFFRKNRLNVLYRQSEKRVVTTANVVVPIAVELVGTQADVDAVATKLSDFGNQISVTKTIKEGITQSFVFDVDADQTPEAEKIAEQLKYEVGATLPSSITPAQQTEIVIAVSSSNTAPAVKP